MQLYPEATLWSKVVCEERGAVGFEAEVSVVHEGNRTVQPPSLMSMIVYRRWQISPQPIKKAFTLCSVALLGEASGIETMIQLNLCLITVLLMEESTSGSCRIVPVSVKYVHSSANAVPTERSLPVSQVTRTLLAGFKMSLAVDIFGSWKRS